MTTDDYEQPVGERPELDLSYTDRDGRHVPVKITGPTPAEVEEWQRRYAELVHTFPPGPPPAVQHRAGVREFTLLALSLVALLAVAAYAIARGAGAL